MSSIQRFRAPAERNAGLDPHNVHGLREEEAQAELLVQESLRVHFTHLPPPNSRRGGHPGDWRSILSPRGCADGIAAEAALS